MGSTLLVGSTPLTSRQHTPPSRQHTPLVGSTPPSRHHTPSRQHPYPNHQRYASYWSAFLFVGMKVTFEKINKHNNKQVIRKLHCDQSKSIILMIFENDLKFLAHLCTTIQIKVFIQNDIFCFLKTDKKEILLKTMPNR